MSVADESPAAARLYLRLGYVRTGVYDVCSYTWHDDNGRAHDETERSELLVKRLIRN